MTRIALLLVATLVALSACHEPTTPIELKPPGDTLPAPVTRPDDPLRPPESRVVNLIMAFGTTCALTADAKLHCWGENRFGEFGNGTTSPSAQPVRAGGDLLFDLVAGSMGTPQVCGVAHDGYTYCWGYNENGELGDGTTTDRYQPVRVDADIHFSMLASSYHTCGLSTNGTAYCWGSGLGGQLGTGSDTSALRPDRVKSDSAFSQITNGMQFSCAATRSGEAQCWGWGVGMGSGSGDRSVNVPTPVSGGHAFRSISAGEEHVCAATTDGEVYCWGKLTPIWPDGFYPTPVRIPTPVPIVSVVSASRMLVAGTSCGLNDQGDAYCWHSGLAAVPVPGRYRFAGLAGGHGQFCGYTPGGAALCWSWAEEQSGGTTSWVITAPQPIPSLPGAS